MTAPTPDSPRRPVLRALAEGVALAVPFIMVGGPFGLLFGVVATEAGLPVTETIALSIIVIAGASQFALVELLSEGAPALIALMAAFAVNLRMLMYAASIAPHLAEAPLRSRLWMAYFLVDQVYAASIRRFREKPRESLAARQAFWLGVGGPMFVAWAAATYVGAAMGEAIPEGLSLDFAPAITFIAIVAPMLRGAANLAAAAVAIAAALALAWMPWSLGLPLAAFAGMLAGALLERAAERRLARAEASAA
jgi:Predicted branched-chain amino acid permease (azaleucine resistance)